MGSTVVRCGCDCSGTHKDPHSRKTLISRNSTNNDIDKPMKHQLITKNINTTNNSQTNTNISPINTATKEVSNINNKLDTTTKISESTLQNNDSNSPTKTAGLLPKIRTNITNISINSDAINHKQQTSINSISMTPNTTQYYKSLSTPQTSINNETEISTITPFTQQQQSISKLHSISKHKTESFNEPAFYSSEVNDFNDTIRENIFGYDDDLLDQNTSDKSYASDTNNNDNN